MGKFVEFFRWMFSNQPEAVDSQPMEQAEYVITKITNIATGKQLTGKYKGYNTDKTKIKVGNRYYPVEDLKIEAEYQFDSAKWVG